MSAHIRYDRGIASMPTSDEGWEDAAAQVGQKGNERARRTDITAVVREGWPYGGKGAPACFVPSLAEMFIDRAMIPFGNPAKVDLNDRLWRLEHPEALFALEHEASHAAHTKWDMDEFQALGANDRIIDVIVTLEEPRIESLAIRHDSTVRDFMRLGAMEVVVKDFHIADTPYGASVAAGLLLARVDAGVLTKGEVSGARRDIVKVLGRDTLDTLEGLWKRFLRLRDIDYAGMVEVAREWLKALGIDPDAEKGEGEGEDPMDDLGAGSLFGEGKGEGEGEGEGSGESLDKRIKARGRGMAAKADKAITEKRGEERAERRAAERAADSERATESRGPHERAFGGHGYGESGTAHMTGTREPTSAERSAARALSRELERLHFHDRVVVKRTSSVPPGRLRGSVAVAHAAALSEGRPFTGDLWTSKQRRVVEETPLTLGLLTDISGSMGEAMAPLASSEWVMATAGAHINAKVASVHFGERVYGIMRAGSKPSDVREFVATDGHEAFKDGALALDRELNLLNGRGARLMVVLSDGHYVKAHHKAYAQKFVPLAIRKGVAVLFLDFTGDFDTSYGATRINVQGLTPAQVAMIVGRAAAQEMRRLDMGS